VQRVAKHQYLFRRGGQFYFRRAVPKDVAHAFGGKTHHTVSLRTDSLARARHALADVLRDFDQMVAGARSLPDPTQPVRPVALPGYEPSREEIDAAVRAWLRAQEAQAVDWVLASDDASPVADELLVADDLLTFEVAARVSQQIKGRRPSPISWMARIFAEREGWAIPQGGLTWAYFERRLAQAAIERTRVVRHHLSDETSPVPLQDRFFGPDHRAWDEQVLAKARTKKTAPIFDLLEDYAKEAKPAESTMKAWKTSLQSLVDHLGHDDAGRVTKADILAWKDALLRPQDGQPGRGQRTVRDKYIAAARTVFAWGERNDRISVNPVEKVAVKVPKRQKLRDEVGLTDAEARIILSASLRAGDDTKHPLRAFARRWVPWLCAYTGARSGEITQLRAEDVMKGQGDFYFILITPAAGSQKSHEARSVPLHPHLIEMGFIDAVKGRSGPLFYNPANAKDGGDGNPQHKKIGERLAAWARQLGVDDKNVQPVHGWRHRFKDMGRRYKLDPETRDVIQGHAPRAVGETYGKVNVKDMYDEVCKMPWYDDEWLAGKKGPYL
jgi:integrase